jgi:hypothetical protein
MDESKPKSQGKEPVIDKSLQLKAILDRMALVQRRHGMEMATIRGQARAYLFAMEVKELGFKPEDIK